MSESGTTYSFHHPVHLMTDGALPAMSDERITLVSRGREANSFAFIHVHVNEQRIVSIGRPSGGAISLRNRCTGAGIAPSPVLFLLSFKSHHHGEPVLLDEWRWRGSNR